MTDRFMLVCTVKDDALNLLEWVAYHRMIGFTDIVVYQNNSSDLTPRILNNMARAGVIRYFDNTFRGDWTGRKMPFQNRAYRRASRLPDYPEMRYCMALDSDEFLHIRTEEGTVQSLVEAMGYPDAIRVSWRVFGNSGLRELDDRLQVERFTQAIRPSIAVTNVIPVKTLFDPKIWKRPGIHLPKDPQTPGPHDIRTGSGRPLEEERTRNFQNSDAGGYGLAQVNHYMIRDSESFLIKSARGSSSHPDRDLRAAYWARGQFNDETDAELASRADALRREMAVIDELTQGRQSAMRKRSLRLWKKRIAELRADPEYAALYDLLV